MTIINNEVISDEAKLRLFSPYFYVPDWEKEGPVALGYLYFGEEDRDPTQPENQKRVYSIQEDGSAIAISQPVRTSAGGVPEYNGSRANLAIDGTYSLTVLDYQLAEKDYFPSVTNPSFSSSGIITVKEDKVSVTDNQPVITFPTVDVSQAEIDVSSTPLADPSQVDSRPLFRDVDYVVTDGGAGTITLIVTPFPANTILRARQNSTTSQSSALSEVPNVYTRPTIADAVTTDFSIGDVVKILADSASNDGLTNDYEVVAENTGNPDGINFIALDNNLQLRLIKTRNKLQAYTESKGTATVLSGTLSVDANAGPVQEVTLSENISSIIFGNVSIEGVTTIQLTIKQDGTGSRSVSFTGFRSAGGNAPTVSAGANEEDIFVFQSEGGSIWTVYSVGTNMSVIT